MAGTTPFRFGVQAASAPSGRVWRERARAAEDMGYSTLWVPDHLDDQWAPLVALTAAAEATTTLRVGALVFDNDYRHPALLAKEIATLDIVSEGRVEFGLGAGWMRSDYEAHGLDYDPPGVRIDRMAEGLAVMKSLWAPGDASFTGKHYSLISAMGRPKPLQHPHPPVLIGGGGRRVLTIAAQQADIVGFNASLSAGVIGPEVARSALAACFDERVAWVREAAGARFESLELHCHTFICMVGAEPRSTAAVMAPTFGISVEEALEVPIVIVGSEDHICEVLEERRERYGFSYWAIPADSASAFAPVVSRLAGT